tara:strand:- start:505 stop:1137 length:633 start_codon:yes stop_codon:yes gene_type:complete
MTISINTGTAYTSTFLQGLAEGVYINETLDERSEIEKLFGMSEQEIFEKFGVSFKKNEISFHGQTTYQIENDAEAKIWLIKKGFIKYVRGKEVWNDEAIEEGWVNGWTPPVKAKAKNNRGKGHVYFVKSKNFHKIGSSSAAQIQRRIKYQKPMEILAVSPKIEDYRKLEKELHHHFADKRVLKYEVFENLNKADIEYIMNKLGNKIAVKI